MSLSQEDIDFLRDERSFAITQEAVKKTVGGEEFLVHGNVSDEELLKAQSHTRLFRLKAKAAHDIWAAWMRWQFKCGKMNQDGSFTIPRDKVDRWQRQMNTEFEDLSAEEKKSDYQVADEFMRGF